MTLSTRWDVWTETSTEALSGFGAGTERSVKLGCRYGGPEDWKNCHGNGKKFRREIDLELDQRHSDVTRQGECQRVLFPSSYHAYSTHVLSFVAHICHTSH